MASRPGNAALFAIGVGARATLIGGLAFAALHLAMDRGYYATALLLVAIAIIVGLDLARTSKGADRVLAIFVDGLLAEGSERPAENQAGAPLLMAAIGRALDRVGRSRIQRQTRIDYLQSLTDTVAAALLAVDENGRVEWSNHAAARTLGEDALNETARALEHIPAGHSAVVSFPQGARLVTVSGFRAPDGSPRRLIALQRLAGELDAVELKAWQDLAKILSHEIMNSLTPICSLAESSAKLLREGGEHSAEAADAVQVIAKRSAGLMSFVERYRRVAELPPPARTAVDVSEIFARIDPLMSALAHDRGVAYASRIESKLSMEADPELIEQVAINLIKNGIDAAVGRPGAKVEIRARTYGDQVAIEVADNGPGISEADSEAVFVPFFSRKAGGSGIGLSLARQIAIAHGGRIGHRRGDTGGTVFRLTLPAGLPQAL